MYEKEYEEYKRLVEKNKRDLKWIFVIMFIATLLFLSTCYDIYQREVVLKKNVVAYQLMKEYSFKRMPNFVVPRSSVATATVLQDGRVLFTGGIFSPLNSTNSTEVYSPVKNKFLKLPNMNDSRAFHSAILLSNGDVLITGGERFERGKGSFPLKSAEIYKTKENKFVKISNMNEEMYNHKMYLLPNNNVLVIETPNKIELFDVKTNTFKKIEGIPYDNKLSSYEFIELNQNTVLMYPYDYQNGKTPIVLMNLNNLSLKKIDIKVSKNNRTGYNISKLLEDEVLVSGCKTRKINDFKPASRVNLATNNEIKAADFPRTNMYGYSSIPIKGGNILFLGGYTGIATSLKQLNSTLLYINSQNKFIKFKNMFYKRPFSSFVMLNNGNYIIWGGSNALGKPYPPEMLVVKNK